MKDEIIIYQADETSTRLEVRIDKETVWLSIEQISILFVRERTVVNRHINNIFKEGKLLRDVVCAFFVHTTQHGAMKEKNLTSKLEYFNLDVIISLGTSLKDLGKKWFAFSILNFEVQEILKKLDDTPMK